ncbi:MAG: peptidoglycan -binding protein [Rhodospirillaceae bacterium]|jgi:chemotaxis protein MotB
MTTIARRSSRSLNTWPGFVDALAALLMVIIFLLMIFVLAQFYLSDAISGRDSALQRLQNQVSELADLIALERKSNKDLRTNLAQLSRELQTSVYVRDTLSDNLQSMVNRAEKAEEQAKSVGLKLEDALKTIKTDKETIELKIKELAKLSQDVEALTALREELEKKVSGLSGKLDESKTAVIEERKISESARAQVALLNKQMATLRKQLSQLEETLAISERKAKEQNVKITSLGKRLNAALASKVQELSRYRSEFFGRLRKVLGTQRGVRVVGDRFVFQSEVLFSSGSAKIELAGQKQLTQLAKTLIDIAKKIPKDIDWVLRVDGHTDKIPIRTPRYASNWELSSARAISVVKLLIDQGIEPSRLVAAGFGQFQPLDQRKDEIAFRRNRRIELKLTQR